MKSSIIFDGYAFAKQLEPALKIKVKSLKEGGVTPKIAAILFREDEGSQLYTTLKKEAAQLLGIGYLVNEFSLTDPVESVVETIGQLNLDPSVTGIIIQKPMRKTWTQTKGLSASFSSVKTNRQQYQQWWDNLVEVIAEHKDVDGLHPQTLQAIKDGSWQQQKKVLPATCKAVIKILHEAGIDCTQPKSNQRKFIIIGKSDLLGLPLYHYLNQLKCEVENIGSKDLKSRIEQKKFLHDASVIVTATGVPNLITGEMVKDGVVMIDAGEPRGDVEFSSVSTKARFLTPVPGGVGPVTISCLLENSLDLVS